MPHILCGVLAITCIAAANGNGEQDAGRRIPVLAWGGPAAGQSNVQRLRKLAECGFTHSFRGFANAADMTRGLDAAREAGIKLLVSCPELRSDPQGTVRRFQDHPALGGYFLQDEPSAGDFAGLSKWTAQVSAADPNHIAYINLFPDYANSQQLGVAMYEQYVDRFVKEVPVQVLSFDYYPIVGTSVRRSWYSNLETILAASRASGKPFWAFALSLAHYHYPMPTIAHLHEQVYSNLAYGSQGIQYFTYWASPSLGEAAPIDSAGKRTPVYDRVRLVNDEVRARSFVFAGSTLRWVRHTGSSIPAGTRRFEPERPIESLTTEGNGAVVSRLTNSGRDFLVIVNRDIANSMGVSVRISESVGVRQIQKDGTKRNVESGTFKFDVEPGDALLLTW